MFDAAFDSDSRRCRCRLRNNRFANETVKASKDNDRAGELQSTREELPYSEQLEFKCDSATVLFASEFKTVWIDPYGFT
ncbi:hypothetical protein Y032_0001g194 [Ancylostoma ceylanicum]|uniref:Uncharacterized protein n=1 Tax=Ancylostoma ceylanicum TaxID=53326 RepID=A0A016W4S9_9BILA|nr:hypothetical protein Y032_0001g194 [Ancylostoma ceylanicum]